VCDLAHDGTGRHTLRYTYVPFNDYEFHCPARTPHMHTASTR
jgi:hypothetical protein